MSDPVVPGPPGGAPAAPELSSEEAIQVALRGILRDLGWTEAQLARATEIPGEVEFVAEHHPDELRDNADAYAEQFRPPVPETPVRDLLAALELRISALERQP